MPITISSLPGDILVSIFHYTLDSDLLYLKSWKFQLRLLATSSQWRALLVPKVYSHVFVCYNEACYIPSAYMRNSLAIDSMQLVSNTSLFASSPDLIVFVKHIHINITNNCQKLEWPNSAISKLALLQPQWNLVSKLSLSTKCFRCIDNIVAVQAKNKQITQLADMVATILPNLHSLALLNSQKSICHIQQLFYPQLLARFANSMQNINTTPSPSLQPSLCTITRLIIKCTNQTVFQLPTSLTQTLISLKLLDIPIDCMWEPAEFVQLEHLAVEFTEPESLIGFIVSAPPSQNGDKPLISFPKLHSLQVTNLHTYCFLLELACLPAQMAHISIEGSARMTFVLDSVQLPMCTKSLSLMINSQQYAGITVASPSLNTMLHKLRSSNNVAFGVMNRLIDIPDVNIFAGPAITSLAIAASVSCIDMLKLLLLLPNLAMLTLKALTLDNAVDAYAQVNQLDSTICPKLNMLDLTCKPKYSQHINQFISSLVPAISTLKTIFLCGKPVYIK